MKQINILKKAAGAISIILLILSLAACGNMLEETKENPMVEPVETIGAGISVRGKIKVQGAAPSRAATTSFDGPYFWYITAYNLDITDSNVIASAFTTTNEFEITFPCAGNWSVSVFAYAGTFTQQTLPPYTSAVFSGSDTFSITKEGSDKEIIISTVVPGNALNAPQEANSLKGSINLPITSNAENVYQVSAKLVKNNSSSTATEEVVTIPPKTFTGGSSSLEASNISTGIYTAKIIFEDAVGNILYSCYEAISVYPGLTTDTWYGIAPYLTNGVFVITSALVSKFGADSVPSTDFVLYNYNSSEDNYDYYLMEDYTNTIPATATLSSSYRSFSFDADGYYYAISKLLDSATYIKSNKPGFGSETVSNTVDSGAMYLYGNMGQDLLVDRKTGFLYLMDTSNVCITQITKDDGEYIFNNDLSVYDSAKSYSFDDSAGNSDPNKNIIRDAEAFAVYNGVAYFASAEQDKLIIADLKDAIRQDGANSYAYISSKSVSLGLNDMDLSSDAEITDMIYQNGAVYMLLNEKHDDFWQDFTYYCRGAVLRYDCLTKEVTSLGWTSDAIDISDKKFYVYNSTSNDGPIVYLKENPDSIENEDSRNAYIADRANWVTIDDTVSSGDDLYPYPALYAPYSTMIDNAFYGPKKFIAIKPKKLVIADEGYCFYTDSNDAFCFKNVNRVVTVDLESFAISSVEDVSVTFETDASGYLNSSGYTDVSALNLSNCIYSTQGYEYQTTDEDPVKLTIPLDED